MSTRIRRHNGGFQVEGRETIHPTIASAASAAGLPRNTYWDYDREQAMYAKRNWHPAIGFLLTVAICGLFLWLTWGGER